MLPLTGVRTVVPCGSGLPWSPLALLLGPHAFPVTTSISNPGLSSKVPNTWMPLNLAHQVEAVVSLQTCFTLVSAKGTATICPRSPPESPGYEYMTRKAVGSTGLPTSVPPSPHHKHYSCRDITQIQSYRPCLHTLYLALRTESKSGLLDLTTRALFTCPVTVHTTSPSIP